MKKFAKAGDIKVGVIGYGGAFNMGRAHLQEMAKAGMTPAAVAELDPERLKVAAQEFPGIETYASVDDMLQKSQVNLLAIITPHNTHAPLAIQCLKAGRHVVCEKPFAITTAECDEMIDAACRSDVVLSTYHNRHWDGCILQAIKTIRSGAIGEVYRVDAHMGGWGQPRDWWRSSKIHLRRHALRLGRAPARIHLPDHECRDHRGQRLRQERLLVRQGQVGEGHQRGRGLPHRPLRQRRLVHAGHLAPLQPPAPGLDRRHRHGGLVQLRLPAPTNSCSPRAARRCITQRQDPPSESEKFYQNIADHLAGGTALVITPQWARRPVHVIDLACQSAAAGRAMPAKYR